MTCLIGSGALVTPGLWAEEPSSQIRPLFREAEEIRSFESNTAVRLEACQYFADEDGKKRRRLAYNCSFPGPEIHVKPGETLPIDVYNELEQLDVEDIKKFHPQVVDPDRDSNDVIEFIAGQSAITNLHTHGFHVSPAGTSDNVMLLIGPTCNSSYKYTVPDYHAPGTHWYHAHIHGSTALQVQGGMAGALIVSPLKPEDDLNPPGYAVTERVMLLNFSSADEIKPEGDEPVMAKALRPSTLLQELDDESQELIKVESADDLHALINRLDDEAMERLVQTMRDLRVELPPLTVNGQVNPMARVAAGRQVQRLRLINAGSRKSDYRRLWVTGHKMYLAAFDGINLTQLPRGKDGQFIAYDKEHPLELAPGNRADVFFLPSGSGSFPLMVAGEIGLDSLSPPAAGPGQVAGLESEEKRKIRFERQLMTFEIAGTPPSEDSRQAGLSIDLESFLIDLDSHLKKLQGSIDAYSTGYLRPFAGNDFIRRNVEFNVVGRSFQINGRSYNEESLEDMPAMAHGAHGTHGMRGATDYLGKVEGDGGLGPQGQTPWPLRSGTEEEWTITNPSSVRHPLHIHVSPFWVTAIREEMCFAGDDASPCNPFPERGPDSCTCPDGQSIKLADVREHFPHDPRLDRWQDTVTLPPKGGSITFRHRVSDFTGLYVVHCHILQHEDRGMMINVLTVPNQETSPEEFFKKQLLANKELNDEIATTCRR